MDPVGLGDERSCWGVVWNAFSDGARRVWEAIAGYFIHHHIFQGVGASSLTSRCIAAVYHSDEFLDVCRNGPINQERAARLRDNLIKLGAQIERLDLPGTNQQIECTLLKASEFRSKIEAAGGRLENQDGMNFIRSQNQSSAEWQQFTAVLEEFVSAKDGNISWKKEADGSCCLGQAAELAEGSCILRCRGPGGVYESKTFISAHLGAGIDLCLFNWPGSLEYEGMPSEGLYYLAAETAYQHLKNKNYSPEHMQISGFCLGAAVAAKLYVDHAAEGPHLLLTNTFTSVEAMITHLTHSPSLGAVGVQAVRSPDFQNQDGFNTESKLRTLRGDAGGSVLLVFTENDPVTQPTETCRTFTEILQGVNRSVKQILWTNLAQGWGAHGEEPLHNEGVWGQYLQKLQQMIV